MPTDDPAATLRRLAPLRAGMGITRLADITGLDRIGLPVFVAVRPNSRSVATSQGKGLTPDAARVAALMEAAETWHAERVDAPLRLAARDELLGRVVDLDRLPLRANAVFYRDRPLLWLEGRDLRTTEPVWLPYELVHTDYRLPQPTAAGCFPVNTNGLAAGRTLDEALRHALCELIERDALSLWHHGGRRGATIAAPGVHAPDCRLVLDALAAAGLAVAILELTSDVDVPTFLAVIADRRDPSGHAGLGTACHPEPDTALLKALLEAVQVRASYIAGARDDLSPDEFEVAGRRAKLHWVEPLLRPSQTGHALPGSRIPVGPDAAAQVAFLLDRLAARGLDQVIAVELTRPEMGIAVVRLVVPGLEGCGDEPDYAPGPRALAARVA